MQSSARCFYLQPGRWSVWLDPALCGVLRSRLRVQWIERLAHVPRRPFRSDGRSTLQLDLQWRAVQSQLLAVPQLRRDADVCRQTKHPWREKRGRRLPLPGSLHRVSGVVLMRATTVLIVAAAALLGVGVSTPNYSIASPEPDALSRFLSEQNVDDVTYIDAISTDGFEDAESCSDLEDVQDPGTFVIAPIDVELRGEQARTFAAEHGFGHALALERAASDVRARKVDVVGEDERAACAERVEAVSTSSEHQVLEERFGALKREVDDMMASDRTLDAFEQSWRRCMSRGGYEFGDVDQMFRTLGDPIQQAMFAIMSEEGANEAIEDLRQRERALAPIHLRCSDRGIEVGGRPTLFAERSAVHEGRVLSANRESFEEFRASRREVVEELG